MKKDRIRPAGFAADSLDR